MTKTQTFSLGKYQGRGCKQAAGHNGHGWALPYPWGTAPVPRRDAHTGDSHCLAGMWQLRTSEVAQQFGERG